MSKVETRIAIALENLVMQLRRRNDQAEAFYREALNVLTQAKEPGSLPSEQPAPAHPEHCLVCARPGAWPTCSSGSALTRTQWLAHHEEYYRDSQENGANKVDAAYYADRKNEERFGPCPEES